MTAGDRLGEPYDGVSAHGPGHCEVNYDEAGGSGQEHAPASDETEVT